MRIVQVRIKNFRGIKELCWTPGKHNVLIGQINSGKSTLLNAMALVLDPDYGRRSQPVSEGDFYGMELMKDGEPVSLEVEVVLSDLAAAEQEEFLEFYEPWDTETKSLVTTAQDVSVLNDQKRYTFAIRMAFRARYNAGEDAIDTIWHYPKFSFLTNDFDYRQCPRADREKVGFFLIPAERDVRQALSFSRYSALDKALRQGNVKLDPQLKVIAQDVQGKGLHLFDNSGFSELITSVERQVSSLLPLESSVEHRLYFDLSALGHYDLMNILRAYIALAGQNRAYPVANQGTGTRQILVLSALRVLSSRRQQTILALEEPETGLHPHMQRALVSDLIGAADQTVITTHSVHVAQVVAPDSVYTVINDGGTARLLSAAVPPKLGEDSVRAVARVRNQSPGEFINALLGSAVLLVEGQGDREAIPVLLRRLASENREQYVDPDRIGLTAIDCLSKSNIPKVAPYYRQHLRKQVFAVIDGDKGGDTDLERVARECLAVFVWPAKHAIERVLLSGASQETLEAFADEVTRLGDEYFVKARSHGGALSEITFNYLKNDKPNARLFAEFLPTKEIAAPVRQLSQALMRIAGGQVPQGVIRIGT